VISYNGAMCRTLSGTPIAHRPVSLDYAQEIVAITTERSLHLNAYVDDDLYVKRLSKWTDLYYIRTGSRSIAVGDMRGWIARAPTKLLIIDHPRNISRLESEFVDRYRGKLYVTRTDDEYLEFMNLDANKGSGLATVAREIGVKQSETMCFGDNYNDLPMLRWAGRPVLMANARPDLLTEFTDIAPDCEEDGVGQYIEHLIQP
jgi:HAD superfamily hydrolase (TIGR01484 family)